MAETLDDILRGAKAALDSANNFSSGIDRQVSAVQRDRATQLKPVSKLRMLYDTLADQPAAKLAGGILDFASIPAMVTGAGPVAPAILAAQGIRSAVNPDASGIERGVGAAMAIPEVRGLAHGAAPAAKSMLSGITENSSSPVLARLRQWTGGGRSAATDISHGTQIPARGVDEVVRDSRFVNQTPEVVAPGAAAQVNPAASDVQDIIAQLRGQLVGVPSAKRAASAMSRATEVPPLRLAAGAAPRPEAQKMLGPGARFTVNPKGVAVPSEVSSSAATRARNPQQYSKVSQGRPKTSSPTVTSTDEYPAEWGQRARPEGPVTQAPVEAPAGSTEVAPESISSMLQRSLDARLGKGAGAKLAAQIRALGA